MNSGRLADGWDEHSTCVNICGEKRNTISVLAGIECHGADIWLHRICVYTHMPQSPDISKTTVCACANLRKVARSLTQFYDGIMRPASLPVARFAILAHLARLGKQKISDLSKVMVMDRTTLTRNLRPLIKLHFVKISSGKDQRARIIVLTEKGRRALEKSYPYWQIAQSKLVEDLEPEEYRNLLSNLASFTTIAQGKG